MATVKLLLLQSIFLLLCFSKQLKSDAWRDLNRALPPFHILSDSQLSRENRIEFPPQQFQTISEVFPRINLRQNRRNVLGSQTNNFESWGRMVVPTSNNFGPPIVMPMNPNFQIRNYQTIRDLKEMEAAAKMNIQALKDKLAALNTAKFINQQNIFFSQQEIKDILVRIDPIFANGRVLDLSKTGQARKDMFTFEFINYGGGYSQIELRQNPNNHYSIQFLSFRTLDSFGVLQKNEKLNNVVAVNPFPLRFHPQVMNTVKQVPQSQIVQPKEQKDEEIDQITRETLLGNIADEQVENQLQRGKKQYQNGRKPARSSQKAKVARPKVTVMEIKSVQIMGQSSSDPQVVDYSQEKEATEKIEKEEVKEKKVAKEKKKVSQPTEDEEQKAYFEGLEDTQDDPYEQTENLGSAETIKPAPKAENSQVNPSQIKQQAKQEKQNQRVSSEKTAELAQKKNVDASKETPVQAQKKSSLSFFDKILMMLSFDNFAEVVQGKKEILI